MSLCYRCVLKEKEDKKCFSGTVKEGIIIIIVTIVIVIITIVVTIIIIIIINSFIIITIIIIIINFSRVLHKDILQLCPHIS